MVKNAPDEVDAINRMASNWTNDVYNTSAYPFQHKNYSYQFDFIYAVADSYNDSSLATNQTVSDDASFHAPQFTSSTLVKVIVLTAIGLLSLGGNIATLASIFRTRRHSSSTVYFLIAHLAVADLMVTFFCILAEALWFYTVKWYADNFTCKSLKFLQLFSLHISTFVLVVIGIDRMCAVRYPMRQMHSRRIVRRGVVTVWALSAILSLPQLVIFSVQKGPFVEDFYQCVSHGFYTADWQEQIYTTTSLIIMFAIPLLVLIVTYTCTFCTISSKEDVFGSHLAHSPMDGMRRKIIKKAKMKSLMVTVVIVVAFIVCWTPYYVMMITFIFHDPGEALAEDLKSAIFFFGSSTAMINPLIYGAFHLSKGKRGVRNMSGTMTTSKKNNSSSSAMSTRLESSSAAAGSSRSYHKRKTHVVRSPEARESFLFLPDNCEVHHDFGKSSSNGGKQHQQQLLAIDLRCTTSPRESAQVCANSSI